jgi:UDP-N-acetylmuramoylalanine--D-glutamate ligase
MTDWAGKRVLVIGLARQGKALARYLTAQGAHVTVTDQKPASSLASAIDELEGLPVEFVLGGHPPGLLEGADLLCLSGGVPADLPLAQQARERGLAVTNDSQVFVDASPAPTIGITGSAGKTTTTALVGRMAERHAEVTGARAWIGGNIGRPMLEDLGLVKPHDYVVMELSSFQLEVMTASPNVAAILNLTPNHLDRHRTMAAYTEAKARILMAQGPDDAAVLGQDDPGAWSLRDRVRGSLWSFGVEKPLAGQGASCGGGLIVLHAGDQPEVVVSAGDVLLRGEHNLQNIAAACAIAAASGIPVETMREAIRGFRGVEHRLEWVRRVRGADWYNDSIATAPERTLAALRSFHEPIVLLAGGRDKDLPWRDWADLVTRRVDHLILFGEAASKIGAALAEFSGRNRPLTTDVRDGLEEAVQVAAERAERGDVVLLSPGGTSFDEFVDFAARGERFRELVNAL